MSDNGQPRGSMYRIVQGTSHNLPDADAFIETLNTLGSHVSAEVRNLFDRESEILVARAPGRLDVMGGIADYSGSLVLQMPIHEATFAALQRSDSRVLRIISLSEDPAREMFFEMPLEAFEDGGRPLEYERARPLFEYIPKQQWAAYVAGVFLVLMRERGVEFSEGASILIDSRVPEGKGVSSSAALEVAAMEVVVAAFDIATTPREKALLCQIVENLVVGAPCGVMDQMTSTCGEESRLLALLCQPAEIIETIAIPDGIAIWGLDSGERHSVSGADYSVVRVGSAMGYRMIAEMAGCETEFNARGGVQIHDQRWKGYLTNLTPAEFDRTYSSRLPEQIGGAEFLSRFQGTADPVVRIAPECSYAVRVPTAHPIYENSRVRRFAELMREEWSERRLESMGELMYESHASYSACGLGSSGTDRLVRLVREAGPKDGLYGARITGGGAGGTVAVIGRRDAGKAIGRVTDRYSQETGYQPYVFSGSSPGSAEFGVLRMKSEKL